VFTASTHDFILFFTSKGRAFIKKGYQIPEAGRSAKGTNIVNILPVENGDDPEKVSAMIRGRGMEEESYLFFVTRNGTVKRIEQTALRNIRSNGIRAITLDEGDELISVLPTTGEEDIFIATRNGMAVCFNEKDVRSMGRQAVGVRGIRLRSGDYVIGAGSSEQGGQVLTVTEKGYGKRTSLDEYAVKGRGGIGVKNYNCTDKTGLIADVKIVTGDEVLLVITDDATIIRMAVDHISLLSRATQGVRIMRLIEGSRVISIECTEKAVSEEEEPTPEEEE
ncbi:MAG: DNA gyrase subunit A, partial [Oscillospiraceae bacterium]|nr:DNA gyrase subunit A [Oscillospiraceae bacterium]